jgi:opacity protein-like surface antigen
MSFAISQRSLHRPSGSRARAIVAACFFLVTSRANADPSPLVPEVGFNYGEVETGRSAGMGGAARALGNGATAAYYNPANIALTRVYHLQALAEIWPEARRQTYGAAAVDSVSGHLAGALAGQYGVLDPDGVRRRWTSAQLALALPLSDKFFVGVSGKYLKLSDSGPPRLGFGLPPSFAAAGLIDQSSVENVTFDAGITARPSEQLAIGLVGTNLTNPGTGFQPLSFGGGVGFGSNDVTAEGDLVADFTTFTDSTGKSRTTLRGMFGFEYLAADHYPLRAGYRYDGGEKTHALSIGLGYIDTQFSVDVALRRTVSGSEPYAPVTTIIIDLQYFVEATGIGRESSAVGAGASRAPSY